MNFDYNENENEENIFEFCNVILSNMLSKNFASSSYSSLSSSHESASSSDVSATDESGSCIQNQINEHVDSISFFLIESKTIQGIL